MGKIVPLLNICLFTVVMTEFLEEVMCRLRQGGCKGLAMQRVSKEGIRSLEH